jgi:hypothetical protein
VLQFLRILAVEKVTKKCLNDDRCAHGKGEFEPHSPPGTSATRKKEGISSIASIFTPSSLIKNKEKERQTKRKKIPPESRRGTIT